jgi:hypothetical protein
LNIEVCRFAITALGKKFQVSIVATLAEVGGLADLATACIQSSLHVCVSYFSVTNPFFYVSMHLEIAAFLLPFRENLSRMLITATFSVNVFPYVDPILLTLLAHSFSLSSFSFKLQALLNDRLQGAFSFLCTNLGSVFTVS